MDFVTDIRCHSSMALCGQVTVPGSKPNRLLVIGKHNRYMKLLHTYCIRSHTRELNGDKKLEMSRTILFKTGFRITHACITIINRTAG
jgi:hypothetical protein